MIHIYKIYNSECFDYLVGAHTGGLFKHYYCVFSAFINCSISNYSTNQLNSIQSPFFSLTLLLPLSLSLSLLLCFIYLLILSFFSHFFPVWSSILLLFSLFLLDLFVSSKSRFYVIQFYFNSLRWPAEQ